MNTNVFLTKKGLENLKKELLELKQVERPKVSKMIGEAKSYGDLSENSEYQAALNREEEVETRIKQIENKIRTHVLVDENNTNINHVSIGSKVELFDHDLKEKISFRISGSTESDADNSIISNESPIGSAIMGKKKGDIVHVDTPDGEVKMEILNIKI